MPLVTVFRIHHGGRPLKFFQLNGGLLGKSSQNHPTWAWCDQPDPFRSCKDGTPKNHLCLCAIFNCHVYYWKILAVILHSLILPFDPTPAIVFLYDRRWWNHPPMFHWVICIPSPQRRKKTHIPRCLSQNFIHFPYIPTESWFENAMWNDQRVFVGCSHERL